MNNDATPQAAPTSERERPSLLDQVELEAPRASAGVHLGCLQGFDPTGAPLVRLYGETAPMVALATVALQTSDVGRQLALVFLNDHSPLVIGLIQNSQHVAEVRLEGDQLVLEGRESLELRCGKASLLMREDGKIIIKGTHLVSRSSGANKIKGASISLN